MNQGIALRRAAIVGCLLAAVAVGACSPGAADVSSPPSVAAVASHAAAPTPTPTPRPTLKPTPSPKPRPTPKPTPKATATPKPASHPDAARGLKIAKPYALTALEPALAAAFDQQLANVGDLLPGTTWGGRGIDNKNAFQIGYVFVIAFAKGVLTDQTYPIFVNGVAGGSGQTFKARTISGVKVTVTTGGTTVIGLYRKGDKVLMVATLNEGTFTPAVAALIAANK